MRVKDRIDYYEYHGPLRGNICRLSSHDWRHYVYGENIQYGWHDRPMEPPRRQCRHHARGDRLMNIDQISAKLAALRPGGSWKISVASVSTPVSYEAIEWLDTSESKPTAADLGY
jgi:hypothetical protein